MQYLQYSTAQNFSGGSAGYYDCRPAVAAADPKTQGLVLLPIFENIPGSVFYFQAAHFYLASNSFFVWFHLKILKIKIKIKNIILILLYRFKTAKKIGKKFFKNCKNLSKKVKELYSSLFCQIAFSLQKGNQFNKMEFGHYHTF